MRKNLRIGTRILAVVVALILTSAAALTCYGLIIKAQSTSLVNDLITLKAGKSTGIEAKQFAQRHHRQIFQAFIPCDADTCSVIFIVLNTWLSELKVEPPAKFEANFSVKNGVVVAVGAYLFRSMPIYPTFQGSAGDVMETVEMPRSLGPTTDHYPFPTPVGKPYLRVAFRFTRRFNSTAACVRFLSVVPRKAGRRV
jgi:hypothetical protein